MKPLGVMKNLYSTTVVFLLILFSTNSLLYAQDEPICITLECPTDITVCTSDTSACDEGILNPLGACVPWTLNPTPSQNCSGGPGGSSFQMMFELNEQQLGVDCWGSHYISRVGSQNVKLFSGSHPEGDDSYIITPLMYLQVGVFPSIDVTYDDGDYDLYISYITEGDIEGTPILAASFDPGSRTPGTTYTISENPLLPSDGIYKIKYLFSYNDGFKPSNMNTFDNIEIQGILIDATCTGGIDFVVVSTHNPGDYFPVGTTPVTYTATYTATDGTILVKECTFNVNVLDITLNITEVQPSCHTLGSITAVASGGVNPPDTYTYVLTPISPSGADISNTTGVFTGLDPGTYTVTATDLTSPNCSEASSIITILDTGDTIAPVVTGAIDETTVEGCDVSYAPLPETTVSGLEVLLGNLLITDNVSLDANITVSSSDSSTGNCPIVITRTYTVTDECGNTSVDIIHIIKVDDTTDPTIDTDPSDETVECDGAGNTTQLNAWLANNGGAIASDTCGGVTWSSDYDALSDLCGATGAVTVIFTATDDCGNFSDTISATFTIEDTTDPTIDTDPSDETVECDGAGNTTQLNAWLANNGGAIASDTCGGVTWSSDYDALSDLCGATGAVTVIFTATDDCGNFSDTISATFTIEDTTDPTIDTPASDIVVECDGSGNNGQINAWLASNGGGVASDACGGVTWSNNYGSLGSDCSTPIEVIFTATDDCGNTNTTSATYAIQDTTDPTIDAVASDETVECDGSGNIAELNAWLASIGNTGAASDDCSSITWSNDYNSLSDDCGATGSTTVTFTATDGCDNTNITSATFTIEDTTDPIFTEQLPQNTTVECDSVPAPDVLTASDSCDNNIQIVFNEEITNQNDECSNNYIITRTWIATDCTGNATELHVQIITVIDDTDPVFDVSSLPQSTTLQCSDSIPALEDIILTATDNCSDVNDIIITATEEITNQNDECSNNYTITRTWIATDCAGNTTEPYVQVITVIDDTDPVFDVSSLPQSTTLQCSDSIPVLEDIILTATDNCSDVNDIIITATEEITNQNDDCSNTYTITRTWIATDCAGNEDEHVQVITVIDDTDPVFDVSSLPQSTTLQCSDSIPALEDIILTATDNCSDVNDIIITATEEITNQNDECSNNYIITRTWIATDCAGNATEPHVQIITVIDDTDPVFDVSSLPQSTTLQCSDSIPALEDIILTATDNCSDVNDIIITATEEITNQNDECSNNYTITRTWIATDCAGNEDEHVQIITVIDDTDPVFDVSSLPQSTTLQCSDPIPALEDIILTATDNCSDVNDIIITATEEITNQNDECSNNYIITRTWIASDCAGNEDEHVQVITVEDNTDPVFDVSSLPQNTVVECDQDIPALEDVILTATDNCSDVNDIIIIATEVITNQNDDCSNTYTITRTWIASDCAGNEDEHIQVINVIDSIDPVFDTSSLPDSTTVQCSDPIPALEDAILTATDNCADINDITITATEVISGQDDECSNTYTIIRTWIATDCAGNEDEHIQVINVIDDTPPMLTLGDDGSAECTGTDPAMNQDYIDWLSNYAGITATDNCGSATLSFTEGEWKNDGCTNTITVTFIATDECGLQAEGIERSFVISDTTAPELISDLDDTIFYCNELPPVPILDIEELCSEDTNIVFTETTEGTEGFDDFKIIRTWVLTDDCGNETIEEQILLVDPFCDCLDDMFISKAITPNGDIYNDYFKVEGIDDCGIPSLKIFNRWGNLVYQSADYDSKKGRWRGTSEGGVTIGGENKLPTGTYYYIIDFQNSDVRPITGHVYLSTK